MYMNRREILKTAALLTTTCGSLSHLGFAANQPRGVLVVVFLRGGADSMNILAPTEDKHYLEARPPDMRVLAQGDRQGLRLPKPLTDADWRLHPACAPLLDLFQSNHAQVLHACGLQNATRSHFEAQEILESSSSKAMSLSPGWLGAYTTPGPSLSNLSAVATTPGQMRSLSGNNAALHLSGELRGAVNMPWDEQGRKVLESLYATKGSKADELMRVGQSTLGLLARIEAGLTKMEGRVQPYAPPSSVKYNNENAEWLNACQSVAQLIRMDIGLQVACLDFGGWDTHEYQGGRINNLLRLWAANMRALMDDVSASGRDATFVVMSEFGRRLKSNASGGTDHGHGGALWVLDTSARTMLPATKWPGLSIPELDQGLDLKATTDIKQVLADIANKTRA